ncbi:ABC transporter permease [Enterococcus rivorum]|uniref:ABC-2 type transporter transmembrane domain-containing protein n=1 Tax=Enterococcus rivorum TaxID=762845 RepID=A0A1E5KU35_9ENTE|nr:ABC transporter permease [Enterococcus rivorum]MBP2097879.1 ABC-2 type transport system permease protein [Enterococcus rivorum]OEH81268.1 hypothetical protein BCR26_05305 [Enterococcus rivorum]
MFWHLYHYRLKVLLNNRILLFWTLIFPILLGLFFTAAFSNLDNLNVVKRIPVGIVTDKVASDTFFEDTLKVVKNDEVKLFAPVILSKKEANQQLINDKIAGYYTINDDKISLTISKQGIQQNVLDSFMNQFLQSKETVSTIQKENPALFATALVEKIGKQTNYLTMKNKTASKGSQKSFYFFTLVGMSCMFGVFWGISNSNDQQANQSPNGIRLSMSPNKKMFIVLANLASSFTIFIAEIYFILAFFRFVYKVDFGTRWGLILLTCSLTVLTALSLGMMLSNILKVPLNQKISISVSIQMICSFLAGMMIPQVKLLINENIPFINKINPVNLVSEALYQLYYYQNIDNFYSTLLNLIILTLVFIAVSIFYERRTQYVSL